MRRVLTLILLFVSCVLTLEAYPGQREGVADLAEEEGRGLLLEECIQIAAQNSFEVKLAQLDYLIAEQDMGIAESDFDTVISAKVGYEEDKRESASAFAADQKQTNTYSIGAAKKLTSGTEVTLSFDDSREWSNSAYVSKNPAHTAEVLLQVRQPIAENIFGYVDRRNIAVTKLSIQNADLATQDKIETVFADVEKAYWDWAFSKKAREIYKDILEKAKVLHEANSKNYDTGLIEKGDFLASQANVLIREKDLLIAGNKYRQAEGDIKLLMNIETAGDIYPGEALRYKELKFDLDGSLNQAFQKRPDYHQAKRKIEIENITLETKANQRWPEIDLVASMAANGVESKFDQAIDNITSEDNTDYFAGLEISMPLENNLARSEYKKAEHNKEKAILNLKKIEKTIVKEVSESFYNYITYEFNVHNLKKACELQYEKLKEEEKRFQYGRSNTKRLIDYQQDYLNAQLQLAGGLLDLELARIGLEKAISTILERYARML
jgi:outer membrane protein TolC